MPTTLLGQPLLRNLDTDTLLTSLVMRAPGYTRRVTQETSVEMMPPFNLVLRPQDSNGQGSRASFPRQRSVRTQ